MIVSEQCDKVLSTIIEIKIIASNLQYYFIPYPQNSKSFEAIVDKSLFPREIVLHGHVTETL